MVWRDGSFPNAFHLVLFEFLEFDVLIIMFTCAPTVASMIQPAQKTGKDLIEPRLLAMFISAGVSGPTMDLLGTGGVKTLALFTSIADTKEGFRIFLEKDTVLGKPDDLAGIMEHAAVMSVYKAAMTSVDVEVEANAKRRQEMKPPQLKLGELDSIVKVYQSSPGGFPISSVMTPSGAYIERKILKLESSWVAESLTRVTNRNQQDINANSGLDFDVTEKQFKLTQKDFGVPLPSDSEGLRARWRTMGLCFIFVKLKHPQVGVLQTADVPLFDRYTEYMFGPQVWGMHIKDEHERVVATPHIGMVLTYDRAIRQMVAELMNAGQDIKTALGFATAHDETKTLRFTTAFNAENSTPRCRACSAPGLRESHRAVVIAPLASPLDQPGPIGNGPGPSAKAQANKDKRDRAKANKQQAKVAAGGVIKKPKALQNGGVGDGSRGPGGAKGAGRAAGGKAGKGGGKLKFKTADGKSICFAFNNKQPCKTAGTCPHAHVCQICEGNHPKADCPKRSDH